MKDLIHSTMAATHISDIFPGIFSIISTSRLSSIASIKVQQAVLELLKYRRYDGFVEIANTLGSDNIEGFKLRYPKLFY